MAPAALTKTSSNTGTTEKDASAHSISGTGFAGPLWLRPGVGDLYAKGEVHTGPFSMPLLRMQNLDKLVALPGSSSGAILDVCCGSGVTTHHLHTLLKEQGIEGQIDVTCGDWSDGQLAYLDQRIKKMGWMKTRTVKMNLEETGQPDEAFDHIVCAQGIFIIADAQSAVSELYRMLKPGGTLGLGNWHKEMWNYDAHDALCQLPGSPNWPQSSDELIATWAQGPWHDRHYVRSMLHARGFKDIKIQSRSEMIPFKNAEDFYDVYDAFIEWITDRYWTEEERAVCKPLMRAAIVKHMNAKYGENRPFEIEKVCLLITARKPS